MTDSTEMAGTPVGMDFTPEDGDSPSIAEPSGHPTQDIDRDDPSARFAAASDDEPAVEPDSQAADNWETQAKYQQSRADKLQAEIDQWKAKANTSNLAPWEPLINELQSNPQALEAVIGVLEGGTGAQAPKLERPTPPIKPKGYSRYEADNEPDSESAKYKEAYDNYQEQLLDYYQQREEARDAEMRQRQALEQQTMQQRQFLMQTKQELMASHNFTEAMANEFIQDMGSPESLNLENLVGFFKWRKSQNRQGQVPEPAKKPAASAPPPAGTGGSQSVPPAATGAEAFVQDLARQGKNLFATKAL